MSSRPIPLIRESLRRLYHHKAFATPSEVERAELIFYLNYLREGMIVFDVGAYIGEMTLLFSKLVGSSGTVHAFEPTSAAFDKLKTLYELSYRRNVVVNHMAVTSKEGIAKIHVYGQGHLSWSSMADRPLAGYGIPVSPVGTEEVLTTTVDAYCEQRSISRVDLLKIDVEGAEYQVLLGAQRMLNEKKILCCAFEYGQTTFDMGNHPRDIQSYLEKLGYRIQNIVPSDPVFPGRQTAADAPYSMHVTMPEP